MDNLSIKVRDLLAIIIKLKPVVHQNSVLEVLSNIKFTSGYAIGTNLSTTIIEPCSWVGGDACINFELLYKALKASPKDESIKIKYNPGSLQAILSFTDSETKLSTKLTCDDPCDFPRTLILENPTPAAIPIIGELYTSIIDAIPFCATCSFEYRAVYTR
jgi:DNA polymerase III sliding clamp (beta) subunit (PCNA family)